MLTRAASVLHRFRLVVVLLGAACVALGAAYGANLFGSLQSGGFDVPGSESLRAQNLLDARLGGSGADVVVLLSADRLRPADPAFRAPADRLLARLAARSEVASVSSYYSTGSPGLLSRDGRETFAVVELRAADETGKEKAYTAMEGLFQAPPLRVTVGGAVPFHVQLNDQIGRDLSRAEMLTFPILLVLLIIVFRGVVSALLPLMIGTVAIVGAFAILRLLTHVTDISIFAVNIVTMMGLGLAIDYALVVVTRFREELARDEGDVAGAVRRTMATAGRAVLFSSLTVGFSLLGLLQFQEGFLRSLGLGALSAVAVAALSATTLLPAVLGLLGRRVNALSLGGRRPAAGDERGFWYRLAQPVMRWPLPVAVAVLAFLLLLGTPFLRARFGTPTAQILPVSASSRVVADRLDSDFAQQGASEADIAISSDGDALSRDNLASLDAYVGQIRALPGVVQVDSPATNGRYTSVVVTMRPAPDSPDAERLVGEIRAIRAPGGLQPLVGGETAQQVDLLADLGHTLPAALATIVVAVLVLLFLMTGSVVVPVKAVIANALSLTAMYGALAWIFQDGHLQRFLDFTSTGSLDATQPILMFAIAFGLSMDYEIFLMTRVKERYDATGDPRLAVVSGLQRTGGMITGAALLLAVVLGAFATSRVVFIKEIGVGLAIAVLMDASVVRCLLVPAVLRLLGRATWWAPRPLRSIWTRIGVRESEPELPATSGPSPLAGEGYLAAQKYTDRQNSSERPAASS